MPRLSKKAKPRKNSAHKKAIRRAKKISHMFYGLPPRKLKRVFVKFPTALVHVGRCAQINYVCSKQGDGMAEYYHRFGPGCQVFTGDGPQPDGSNILIIKGRFQIKSVGITG